MMSSFILPLSSPAATGPTASGRRRRTWRRWRMPACRRRADSASRPMPIGGRSSISNSPMRSRAYPDADQPTQRRLAVEIRLKLYQSDLAPDVLADVLTAWWAADKPAAVRSSSLIEDRAGIEFRRPVRKLSRRARRWRISHQLARLLGGAVDHHRAALHGAARPRSRRHRDGGAGAAARRRARLGRRFERDRRRPDADVRHVGPRLGDRARRSGAGPHRAQPPRFRALERTRPQASSRNLRARRRHRRRRRCRTSWCARRASKPARRRRSAG